MTEMTEGIAERVLVSAMAMNPLVALDRSQLLAAGGRVRPSSGSCTGS